MRVANAGKPPRRDTAASIEQIAPLVEEEEVEIEAHAEGVHARAARDEQPCPGLVASEPRQAKQAAAEAGRDRDLAAEDDGGRQPLETRWR